MPIWRKEHEKSRVIVHYIGLIVAAIAVTALCGQLARMPLFFEWGHTGSMSLPTAVSLLLCGIGFWLVSRGEVSPIGSQ
jgi:hypothetical protein